LYRRPNELTPPIKSMAVIVVAVKITTILKPTDEKGDNETFIIPIRNAR
jgi:hypothetical protein